MHDLLVATAKVPLIASSIKQNARVSFIPVKVNGSFRSNSHYKLWDHMFITHSWTINIMITNDRSWGVIFFPK